MKNHLHCFKCEKEIQSFDDNIVHPNDGLVFHTYGHYGSRCFDPMNGDTIEIVICDSCLTTNIKNVYRDVHSVGGDNYD